MGSLLQPADSDGVGRFRQIPTFSNGVIRRFSNNTSEMKRLAARDFEDILQVFSSRLTFTFDLLTRSPSPVCYPGVRRAISPGS
jgi:hypothetical protein